MHARNAIALAAVMALAYACGSRSHAFSMVTAAATAGGVEQLAPVATPERRSANAPALTTSLDVTVHDEEVRFLLRVTNTSSKKLELTFPNGQTHDITVVDAVGGEVWRWGQGQMFTQALRNQPLDGHASLTYAVRWRRPAAHGPLTAIATLTSTNYPVESRAPFALP
jgi:hypothetical protein